MSNPAERFLVRSLSVDDATELPSLVVDCYGDTYPKRDLYDVELLGKSIRNGTAVARSQASLSANPVDVHRATDAVLTAMDELTRSSPHISFSLRHRISPRVLMRRFFLGPTPQSRCRTQRLKRSRKFSQTLSLATPQRTQALPD